MTIWQSWSVRRRVLTILATVGVIAGGGVAAYLVLKRPGDVSNPDAPFEEPDGEKKIEKDGKDPKDPKDLTINWPIYGYDAARTKYLPAPNVKPPFRQIWSWDSEQLIEFSPIVVDDVVYGMNNDALFFALDAETGKVLWKKQPGSLNASSPAYYEGKLFAVNLDPPQVFALRAKDGKMVWQKDLPGRAEASPIVYEGTLYFGSEGGNVYAMDPDNGDLEWQTPTEGDVKGGPAIVDDVLYTGDYAGEMYAMDAKTGEIIWQAGDLGTGFGQSGRFYGTVAVAFGRVYAGNVDGRVYSFDAKTGDLAWSHSAGNYVYSGVVVADTPDTDPAVYFGSHDQHVYALDARTGEEIWVRDMDGIISGAGAVIGDLYYVSVLAGFTYGLDLETGEIEFEFEKGEYNPAISDGVHLFVTGYSSINAFEVKKEKPGESKGGKDSKKGDEKPGGNKGRPDEQPEPSG